MRTAVTVIRCMNPATRSSTFLNNFGDFFDLVPVKADIKFFGNNITSRLTNADIDNYTPAAQDL